MTSARAPRQFFTALHMRHWRNFKGPVDMTLRRRAFLVGPNAAGKSNILDALRFLRDIASDGLQKAVGQRGGMGEIRTLQATQPPGIELRVSVGTDDAPALWKYHLKFRNHPQRHLPEVLEEKVYHRKELILQRPDKEDKKDRDRLTQTHLEQTAANQEFRELNKFLQSIRYLHIVPHLVRDPERSIGKRDDPFGGDFLEKVAAAPKRTREARLRKINKALQLAIPQFEGLNLQQDAASGRWHLEVRFRHWRSAAGRQYEGSLSDGTLRLIGLLWALAEGGGPLLLEEPELSLHDDLVRRLPGIMAKLHLQTGRQVLISTHSPVLLADEGIGLDEVHVLAPGPQGTSIELAVDDPDVCAMTETGGIALGDIIMPQAAPEQGYLFDFSP